MPTSRWRAAKNRGGFTLVELLVVLVIVSLTTLLVLSQNLKDSAPSKPDLKNIREFLASFREGKEKITLIAYDECKKLAILKNSLFFKQIDTDIIDKDVEVFRLDAFLNPVRVKFTPFVHKEEIYEVCFRADLFPNGSISSYIVKNGNRFYVFKPFFEKIESVSTLKEALKIFVNEKYMPFYGNYYEK